MRCHTRRFVLAAGLATVLSAWTAAPVLAQSSELHMYYVKVSPRQMAALGLPASGPDVLQVWVSTDSPDTKAFKVSVRYSWQDKTFSDSRTVERNWGLYSGAVLAIPDVGIKVLSVTVEELKSANSKEFPGEQ